MADRNDIKSAKDKIDDIIELGKKIQDSTPHLINIKANLNWYEETCDAIKNKEEEILHPLTGPLEQINKIDYTSINVPLCSGIAATFMSASAAETRETVLSTGNEYHYLLDKYSDIYESDALLSNISDKVKLIDSTLNSELDQVKNCYYQWKSDLKSNSDLAKDARTFLEHFKGTINKLRVPMVDWGKVDIPEKSWPKMVDKISKNGSENKRAFMKQQKISEDIWKELTPIMKKTIVVDKVTMDSLFKRCIEHLYAVLNLIDENILNQ